MADQFVLPRGVIVTVFSRGSVGSGIQFCLSPTTNFLGETRFQFNGDATAFVVKLKSSTDGGATFKDEVAGLNFFAVPTLSLPLKAGFIYQLEATTLSGGTPLAEIKAVVG